MLIETLPKYTKPLKCEEVEIFDEEYWNDAIEHYDNKKYHDTILSVLKYINSEAVSKWGVKRDLKKKKYSKFKVPHDSITIEFKLDSEFLEINVSLVQVQEDTNVVALLRKIAEVNFDYYDLAHLNYKDGKVYLEHKEPIELCKPSKLYWLIHEIAVQSDKFLNLFCQRYNTKPIKEPPYKKLTEKEKEYVKKQIEDIFSDYDKYKKNFIENQKENYVWDIVQISLLKLYNIPQINGYLQHELIRNIGRMYDNDYNFKYRIEKGVEFIEELKSRSFDEIEQNLYHPKKMIHMLYLFSPENIAKRLLDYSESVKKYEKDGNHMGLCFMLTERLLNIVYDYDLNKEYKKEIEKTLLATSNQEYKSASKKLSRVYYKLVNQEIKPFISFDVKVFLWVVGVLFLITYIYETFFI